MKAVVYEKYGFPDVLEMREIDKPTIADDELLVRVHATSVNAGDWHLLTATPWVIRLYSGLFKPKRKVLGHDVAGEVEAVGSGVTQFQPGDEVFGATDNAGAFAEYMAISQDCVVKKPASVAQEDAAASPQAALTALHGLRDKGQIQAGQKVLINGAAGGVGTFAVQIAKSFGAEVTGVGSTDKCELVRSLGAEHVVDYTQEDFTKNEGQYDLMLDIVGNRSLADCRRVLRPEGMYVAAAGAPSRLLKVAMTGGKKMVSYVSTPNQVDLGVLSELLGSGSVKPVIDRRYTLGEVPEAMRYIGEGHARGKVIVTI